MSHTIKHWHSDHLSKRLPYLKTRAKLQAAIRGWFLKEGFMEVDTPILQVCPGMEPHIMTFETKLYEQGVKQGRTMYLHTSPEFAMKKLLAGGMEKIFQFAHVFRNGENSEKHSPEFTMLEWYRANETYEKLIEDCTGILRITAKVAAECGVSQDIAACVPSLALAGEGQGGGASGFRNQEAEIRNFLTSGTPPPARLAEQLRCSERATSPAKAGEETQLRYFPNNIESHIVERDGMKCDLCAKPEILTVAEAFKRYADIDILATAPNPLMPDAALLAKEAARVGIRTAPTDSWEDIFFRISLERIEPHLGKDRPTFFTDYPVSMAAPSRPKKSDPRLAERFELYVCGLELANAFGELTDVKLQRQRFEADMALKKKLYGTSQPIDEDFMEALSYMPESTGIALGFDRLAMLASGAKKIEDVLWLPV